MDMDNEKKHKIGTEALSSDVSRGEIAKYLAFKIEEDQSEALTLAQGRSILRQIEKNDLSLLGSKEGEMISYLFGLAYKSAVELSERYYRQRSMTP